MSFNIETYLSERRKLFNSYLQELYKNDSEINNSLIESINYSLTSGGKRFRPILCMASYELFSDKFKKVVGICCAIEMVHSYSLIHDDLPSMDDDNVRRGKASNHIKFGESTAILAGDALLADAFSLITNELVFNGCNPEISLKVISILSNSIGSKGMVLGQAMDLFFEGKENIDVETLSKIHFLKTGALIEASIMIGAHLGGANEDELELLRNFSRKIGLSFQISDDILDITGSKDFGKQTGSDAKKNKQTFASVLGIDRSKDFVKSLTEEALRELDKLDKKINPIREITIYLSERTN